MAAGYLRDKVVFVVGGASPEHRGVAVAMAEAGADVVVAGSPDKELQAPLNSIANEVWAIGRRSLALGFDRSEPSAFAAALERVRDELGRVDLVVWVDPVAPV